MKRFVLLLFILINSFAFSQTSIKNGVVIDSKAEKIINSVAQKLKSESPISISFSFTEKVPYLSPQLTPHLAAYIPLYNSSTQ